MNVLLYGIRIASIIDPYRSEIDHGEQFEGYLFRMSIIQNITEMSIIYHSNSLMNSYLQSDTDLLNGNISSFEHRASQTTHLTVY